MFTGTGTLLVDDVLLQPGFHEEAVVEAAGPAQKGNRVYNSGFEAGTEGRVARSGLPARPDEQGGRSDHGPRGGRRQGG